jgi:hypothetical protein
MTKELRIAELDVIWALEAIMEFFSGSAAFRGTGRDLHPAQAFFGGPVTV